MKNRKNRKRFNNLTLADKLSVFKKGYTIREEIAIAMLKSLLLEYKVQDEDGKPIIVSAETFSSYGIGYFKSYLLNESTAFVPVITITKQHNR